MSEKGAPFAPAFHKDNPWCLSGQNGVSEMAGTKAGGKKAAATNRTKYGKDFYAEIGRKGGKNGHTGGFAANPELAKIAGAKGGRISRRGKAKKNR